MRRLAGILALLLLLCALPAAAQNSAQVAEQKRVFADLEKKIAAQEQEQMLDAIQAQEDKTQEKLKEKQGVVVRGRKNW